MKRVKRKSKESKETSMVNKLLKMHSKIRFLSKRQSVEFASMTNERYNRGMTDKTSFLANHVREINFNYVCIAPTSAVGATVAVLEYDQPVDGTQINEQSEA